MTLKKVIAYLSLAAMLMLCLYRGIQVYNVVKPPVTTTAPTAAPKPGKLTYSIIFTREVKVGDQK
jgi:hypothetical protein